MVNHIIHDDADMALFGLLRETVKIRQGAVHGVDILVIRYVVAEIHLRRWVAWRNPDGVNTQVMQIVELGRNALQIADPVVVAVGKAARINFVEHRVLPPLMAFGVDRLLRKHFRTGRNSQSQQDADDDRLTPHEIPPLTKLYQITRNSKARLHHAAEFSGYFPPK